MLSVLVVADDLTGANATGAMFARLGLRTRTVSRVEPGADVSPDPEIEVLVLTTRSRLLAPEAAADSVTAALRSVDAHVEPRLTVKRVDTTLRGPLAAELDALLAFRRGNGTRVVALAVPAYPAAGRTTVGGIHLLEGRPLARSAVARDPVTPVRDSRVSTLLTTGTDLRGAEVHLDDLAATDFPERLDRALLGSDVVVVDCASDADLGLIADAAAGFQRAHPDIELVVVDSGPFGAACAHAMGMPPTDGRTPPILLVIGSTAAQTHDQLRQAQQGLTTRVEQVDPARLGDPAVRATLEAVDDGIPVVGWHTTPPAADVDRAAATGIPDRLAQATRAVASDRRLGGLFTCGGEVTAAVLSALEADGLDVEAEVQPLVVTGRLCGGPWHGLPIVTKGGLIGDDRAILDSIFRLRVMLATSPPAPHQERETADD